MKRPLRSITTGIGSSPPVANGEPGNGVGTPVTGSMAKPEMVPLKSPATYTNRPEGSIATARGLLPTAAGLAPAGVTGVHACVTGSITNPHNRPGKPMPPLMYTNLPDGC